jgi:SAM-dependent methyltransferase
VSAADRQDPRTERAHFEAVLAKRGALYWAERTEAGRRRRDIRGALVIATAEATTRPVSRILEIGCGIGEYTRPLAANTRAHVTALDVAPPVVALARTRVPANVAVCAADVEELPFAAGTFDAVVGNAVLHHLRLEHTVPELVRVLRPGGAFVFAEPNMLNPHVALERNVRFIGRLFDNSPGETAFVRWRLRPFLAGFGLVDVRIRPFDFLYPLTPVRLIPVVQRLGRVLERTPLVAEIAGSLLIAARAPAA